MRENPEARSIGGYNILVYGPELKTARSFGEDQSIARSAFLRPARVTAPTGGGKLMVCINLISRYWFSTVTDLHALMQRLNIECNVH